MFGGNLGGTFHRKVLKNTPWERAKMNYSIMALHTRYNRKEMKNVMGPNTKYITMLRDPVDLFESAYVYYRMISSYNMTLEEFAQKTDREKPKKRVHNIGKNQMLYDFGLNENQLDHRGRVADKIKEIEENFDFVMIAEYFSESLILLKHQFCWDLLDVTSFHLNGRMDNGKYRLSNTTRSLLAEYLKNDFLLYNHFKEKFIQRLTAFGFNKLEKEVKSLNYLNENIFKACKLKAEANIYLKGDQKWYGPPFLVGFNVNKSRHSDCKLMTMSGLKYIERIRKKQLQEAEKLLESM